MREDHSSTGACAIAVAQASRIARAECTQAYGFAAHWPYQPESVPVESRKPGYSLAHASAAVPGSRDRRYLLPWTRLHALKDYWGMVKVLEEFPGVHTTFNFVPLLAEQIEEYASGKFKEPWFEIAFATADTLDARAEARNHRARLSGERNLRPALAAIRGIASAAAVRRRRSLRRRISACATGATCKCCRSSRGRTKSISPTIPRRAAFGKRKDYTEARKRAAAGEAAGIARRGPARIPPRRGARPNRNFHDALLPSDSCRCSAIPTSPAFRTRTRRLPQPAFAIPKTRASNCCARREFHERVFGKPPAGLWPSEGSVSDQALEIAMELGFKWFATDEGVLGRTRNIGFWRDAAGYPENGPELVHSLAIAARHGKEMSGFFRDHYLSDLVGFVYSRMSAEAAAEDLHRRIRAIGDREPQGRTATVSVILDGENAWEYYPGNGSEFLREFYRRIQDDPEIRALTVSEAMEANAGPAVWREFSPPRGSTRISMCGSAMRRTFAPGNCCAMRAKRTRATRQRARRASRRSRRRNNCSAHRKRFWRPKAAIGTGGTARSTVRSTTRNSIELYRKHLTEIYTALGEQAPERARAPDQDERRSADAASRRNAYLDVTVDGRESSYFEWLGAGLVRHRTRSGDHARPRLRPRRSPLRIRPKAIFICAWTPCRKRSPKFPTSSCASRSGIRARRASPCAWPREKSLGYIRGAGRRLPAAPRVLRDRRVQEKLSKLLWHVNSSICEEGARY